MNFSKLEKKILNFWDKNKIFEKSIKKNAPKGDYIISDGPPFATGMPHYGHIAASLMKDVVPRYWTMKGYRIERRWGWDCHGLPVENLAEKELKLKNKQDIERIGIEKFNRYCKSIVLRYAKKWKKIIKRIARWVDMEDSYKTMDLDYMESIWWVFKSLWDKKLIYKGHKAMHICPRCGTTLSNFEVTQNYKDIKDIAVVVKFEILNLPKKLQALSYLLAWTTTPWTLIGNCALAVGKDIDYVLIKTQRSKSTLLNSCKANLTEQKTQNYNLNLKDEYFILAKKRLKEIFRDRDYKIIKKFKGEDLIGLRYKPLFDYYFQDEKLENRENGWKVYEADFVTVEEGTGIVHIAPAFGEDDMNLGKKNKLPFIQHVDINGRFKKEVKDWQEIEVKPKEDYTKTDIEIIRYLANKNLLFAKEKYEHKYPHCWRCETPLLNYATESWFVNVLKIKQDLIKNNQKIFWVPSHIKDGRFGKWLDQARDWAISRNRYWGTPLPVWQCQTIKSQKSKVKSQNYNPKVKTIKNCGNIVIIGSKADLLKQKFSTNRYFLLRHGESVGNVKKITSNWPEKFSCHLTKRGERQIKIIAEKLKDQKIDLIFASDLLRTKQTAEIVAKKLNLSIIYDKRLRETKHGVFNGRPTIEHKQFWEKPDLNSFENYLRRFKIRLPKGENYQDVKKRIYFFLKEVDRRYQGKNILIVSHEIPLKMLIAACKGLSPEEIIKWDLKEKIMNKTGDLRKLDFNLLPYNKEMELDFHRPYIDEIEFKCKRCNGQMKRIPEIFDCWFESGSAPYAQNHYPFENKQKFEKNFPVQFIAEGIDQTRGWFYTLMVLSTALFNKPCFQNVIVNGIVLAEDGQKMSKRLNNYPDPAELFEKYSVDALRYYLLSSPVFMAENLNFSEKGVKEILRKVEMILWNCFSFFITYGIKKKSKRKRSAAKNRFQRLQDIRLQQLLRINKDQNLLDRWIISRLNQLIEEITIAMDRYNLPQAVRPIADFIDDLSTWYLRCSRDRFKSKNEKEREMVIDTMGYVLLELSKIIAPFMPFISERIYQDLKKYELRVANCELRNSVHLEDWPKTNKKLIDERLNKEMYLIREINSLGLKARIRAGIKVKQPLSNFQFSIFNFQSNFNFQFKDELLDLIKKELNVKKIEMVKKLPKGGNWIIEKEKDLKIALNIEITLELKEEGQTREIIRQIQNLRRQAGLTPKNRILIYYSTDPVMENILLKNKGLILEQTKSKNLQSFPIKKQKFLQEKEFKIDNQRLHLAICT